MHSTLLRRHGTMTTKALATHQESFVKKSVALRVQRVTSATVTVWSKLSVTSATVTVWSKLSL